MSMENLLLFYDDKLITDATLQGLFPGNSVRLFWEWAPDSDETDAIEDHFPYIVHKLDTRHDPEVWGLVTGRWSFSVYSYGDSARESIRIAKAITGVLQRRFYEEPEGIRALRIWKTDDLSMSRSTRNAQTHRRDLLFELRYWDQDMVETVVARVEAEGH